MLSDTTHQGLIDPQTQQSLLIPWVRLCLLAGVRISIDGLASSPQGNRRPLSVLQGDYQQLLITTNCRTTLTIVPSRGKYLSVTTCVTKILFATRLSGGIHKPFLTLTFYSSWKFLIDLGIGVFFADNSNK